MGVKNKEITIECDGQQSCIRETEGGAVRVLTKDDYELVGSPESMANDEKLASRFQRPVFINLLVTTATPSLVSSTPCICCWEKHWDDGKRFGYS
jgi:hypothetical protein